MGTAEICDTTAQNGKGPGNCTAAGQRDADLDVMKD